MKKLSIILLLNVFLLSGCSLLPKSAEEKAYAADCAIVQSNFAEYAKMQEAFDDAEYNDPEFDWSSWSGGYAITNAGQSAREATYNSLTTKFPWIYSIAQDYLQNVNRKEFLKQDPSNWSDEFEWQVYEAFFKEMVKGSSFNVTIDLLKKVDESSYSLYLDRVLAQFAPTDRFKNCDEVLGLKDEQSFEKLSNEYGLYGNSGVGLSSVSELAVALWGCKKFGVGYVDYGAGFRECAAKDFEMDWSTSGPSEPSDEELAILAERKAQAERDAQAPSSSVPTSNARPGQICTSLGEMVSTEDYGTLMCKLVWAGKIKALLWMRA